MVREFTAKLETGAKIADKYLAQATADESKLTIASKPADAAQAVRDSEIRRYFAEQDRSRQQAIVSSAIDSRDFETLTAVLTAPASMKLLTSQIEAHVRRQVLQIQHGPELERVERTRRIAQTSRYALDRASSWVKQRAGITESPADRLRKVEGKS